jgi:lipoprotein-anchoring transpeptidase ErfK/SrfK
MGRKALVGIVCGVIVLIAAAVGAYAWDNSKADEIAEGVRVGHVDLGGLNEQQATELLEHELVKPYEKPVVATHDGEDYTLHAKALDVRADVDGMVAEALSASRDGGLPSRLIRYATGGEVDHRIEPRVAYSETAVERFIEGVAAKVNVEPQDASINPSTTSLEPVPAKDGYALRENELRADITDVLENGGAGPRSVKARVETLEPEVTTKELAAQYPDYITIDRATFTLRHYEHLKLVREYTVAVGQVGYDTPTGVYNIETKEVDPVWNVPDSGWAGDLAGTTVPPGPSNPLKARWMGIYAGAGIHGTDDIGSLGSAASHGCIRMSVPDVIALFDQVEIGTPVYIQ